MPIPNPMSPCSTSTRPKDGMDVTVSYMRKLPREAPAGTKWVYKTGETNLIGVLVSSATKKKLADYLSEKIWAPFGMEQDGSWLLGSTGHEISGCCIQASTRDYARFGMFMLGGAQVDGKPFCPMTGSRQQPPNRPTSASSAKAMAFNGGPMTMAAMRRRGYSGRGFSSIRSAVWSFASNSNWPKATDPENRRAAARGVLQSGTGGGGCRGKTGRLNKYAAPHNNCRELQLNCAAKGGKKGLF